VRCKSRLTSAPAPAGETRSQRRHRSDRETDVWMRLVRREGALSRRDHGRACASSWGRYVSVLLQACRAAQTHFLVRALENRGTLVRRGAAKVSARVRSARGRRRMSTPWTCPPAMAEWLVRPRSNSRLARLSVLPPRNEPRASPRADGGVGDPSLGRTHAGGGRTRGRGFW
jgi:hypothetical protein